MIKFNKKSLVYIIVASLALSNISVLPVKAVDVDALEAEIKVLQSEKSALQKELSSVNSKLTLRNNNIDELEKEKVQLGNDIKRINEEAYEHYESLKIKPLESQGILEAIDNIQKFISIKSIATIKNQAYSINQSYGEEKEILTEYWLQKKEAFQQQGVIDVEIEEITELKVELESEVSTLTKEISSKTSKINTNNNKIQATKVVETPTVTGSGTGQEIVNYALQFIGNPYKYGGTSLTNGTDCSGFVQAIFAKFGYSLPRTTVYQISCGTKVTYSSAVPGDLIFYSGHVGIYMGNGQIVHASNESAYPKGGIKTSPATWDTIKAVRRIVN